MFTVRRSVVDSSFLEVLRGDEVIREIEVPFQLWRLPSSFHSMEEVERWLEKMEKKLARKCVYSALARRNHSSRQLLEKLKRKRFSAAVCVEVLEEVKRLGYLCDEEFFQRAVEKECARGKGPRYIARKLGMEEEKVRELVPHEMQREQIRKLKERGVSSAALARRGFDLEQIFES